MIPANPFFDVKPLEQGGFAGITVPITGAEFQWNPMTTLNDPVVAGNAAATTAGGAFFTMRTVESGGADNGDIYLQGGNVSGGTGNAAVTEFLLFDASGPTWSGTAGQFLELAITGSGQETSGILDPIYNVTSVSTPAAVGSLGANTLPSSGDVAGKVCRVSLGTFITDGFQPAAIGDINIGMCWGGYTINRIA